MNHKLERLYSHFIYRYLPLTVLLLFIMIPFYWTINTSLKHEANITKMPIQYLPTPATLENFILSWNNVGFSIFFRNSMFIALATVLIVLILSILAGYAISRFQFKGKNAFMLLLLCTQFVPGAMLLIPLFMQFKAMSLTGTHLGLIITYSAFQLPFNAILMSGFIRGIPEALEEAAEVDGCNRLQAIYHVILPILVPGLVATSVFTFIGAWNEFLFALMFITKKPLFTLPVGLSYMQGEFDINYGALAAGSVIALVPVVILFSYVQKYLVQGLGAGAVKG
ncbi:carbohydrate ABC transporter permease [Paenibacillus fonticola]|uniref:carbohydrate ABC transporter permease n=1 Tax=Paenibacillus fonticola TaxID=379896 RepID=UPI00037E9773|nr:carbohydrate ABC transporter permease [Paenibacillus fonticola]